MRMELLTTPSEDDVDLSSSESLSSDEKFCFEFEPDSFERKFLQNGKVDFLEGSTREKSSNAYDEILVRHKMQISSKLLDNEESDMECVVEASQMSTESFAEDSENELDNSATESDSSVGENVEDDLLSEASTESHSKLRDISSKFKSSRITCDTNQKFVAFSSFSLSRPILKGLTELNFLHATPVQQSCIPLILAGKDLLASAVTGSGKTAAFAIPILERLLYRRSFGSTRVLILTPTRELAHQCHSVIEKFAIYTNGITSTLITGGVSLKTQEQILRKNPEIIVATPGRIIDHLLNTVGFSLERIDTMVLDEADRLLELGFIDQLNKILRECPKSRQTLLFSATLTENVESLARDALRSPQRISLDPLYQVSEGLVQEFVRVRNVEEREAILLSLLKRFSKRVLIFCMYKSQVHRLRLLMTLLNFRVAEFHGDLPQSQRFEVLKKFRDGDVDFLVASDVAARGLDITGIETVINYELPSQIASYVHRVGRTARAGSKGRAISLVLKEDYKLFKSIVKNAVGLVLQRTFSAEELSKWMKKVLQLIPEIDKITREENEEKEISKTEMLASKAQNIIEHKELISQKPERVWFQSKQQKERALQAQVQQFKKQQPFSRKREKEGDRKNKIQTIDRRKTGKLKPNKQKSAKETDESKLTKKKKLNVKKDTRVLANGRRETRPTKSIFDRQKCNMPRKVHKKAFKSKRKFKRR